MNAAGSGGRIGYATEDLSILSGLINFDPLELLKPQQCANPKCGRYYRPRAEGDNYCNERCDPLNKPLPKHDDSRKAEELV